MEPSKGKVNESGDSDEQNSIVSLERTDDVSIDNDADAGSAVSIKNVNELKVLDFYSADDVRQSIKSAIASKAYTFGKQLPTPKFKEVAVEPPSKECEKHNEHAMSNQNVTNERVNLGGNNLKQDQRSSGTKRRGRPIKTGPSKRPPKRFKIDDFYIGKLSNFVPYKRKGESESDFDSESGVLY